MSEFNQRFDSTEPTIWGGVTDPSEHDPKEFRYLVHALNPYAIMSALQAGIINDDLGVVVEDSWGDQSISLYEDPEKVAARISLSASLIDQDHVGTWGKAGLILEVPNTNIVHVSESDAGTNNSNLPELLAMATELGDADPDALLARTAPSSYNEVVAVADVDGNAVQLKGFFYKTTGSGRPTDEVLTEQMVWHSKRLGLPLVKIEEPSLYAEDTIDVVDGKVGLHYGGERYLLDGFGGQTFTIIDDRFHYRFASPDEMKSVLHQAEARGFLTADEVAVYIEKYQAANKQRQTPTVTFDEDGTIDSISFFKGYGRQEHAVRVSKSGYATETNTVRQEARIARANFVSYNEDDMYDAVTPLSRLESAVIVEQACTELDPETAQAVREWFAGISDTIEQNWRFYDSRERGQRYSESLTHGYDGLINKLDLFGLVDSSRLNAVVSPTVGYGLKYDATHMPVLDLSSINLDQNK